MPSILCAFGLGLRANQPIPGLDAAPTSTHADIEMQLGLLPSWFNSEKLIKTNLRYVSDELDEQNNPILTIWALVAGNYFLFRYADGTQFIIDKLGTQLWATWPEPLTVEDTATYLLGPIMGFVLLLRGKVCLHASAIVIGQQAVALVGPSGAGKSTTAAAFARLGCEVLADDIVALVEQDKVCLAQPAYPRLRLWPESVHTLYGSNDALPLLTPNWDKRYLDLMANDGCFQTSPLPLAAIYFLNERSNDMAAPFVQPLTGKQGLMGLVANTYASRYMNKDMQARGFGFLSRLAANVPVRQVVPHADPAYLSRLCEVIINDVKGLPARL